jgi:hypothetical protein
LKELKRCFKVFLCFLSIGIPYYKEGHVDEVKIINSSDSKYFQSYPKQKLPAGQCPTLPEKASNTHRESQLDNVRSSQTMSTPSP